MTAAPDAPLSPLQASIDRLLALLAALEVEIARELWRARKDGSR
jgi:hypothetical protein